MAERAITDPRGATISAAGPVFSKHMEETLANRNLTVVSPDVGGVVRARAIAKRVDADLATIDKRRE